MILLILRGIAALTATVIPATEGYLHARNGTPPQPSYGLASLTSVFAGSVIESEKSVERVRATGVISEGVLKEGYKIFRWPVGVTTAYLGMYKAGYFLGSLPQS